MTREEAIKLVKEYDQYMCWARGCEAIVSIEIENKIKDLAERIDNPEHSTEKCMRWLGFIQGILWMSNVFSIEQLKAHSKNRRINNE